MAQMPTLPNDIPTNIMRKVLCVDDFESVDSRYCSQSDTAAKAPMNATPVDRTTIAALYSRSRSTIADQWCSPDDVEWRGGDVQQFRSRFDIRTNYARYTY